MTELAKALHSANVALGASAEAHTARISEEPQVEARTTPQAFEAIYDEYFDFVWRSLRRLGLLEAVLDDAVQDVFLVVHRRLPDFEGRSALKTWLFGIAIRVAAKYRRGIRPTGEAQALDSLEAPNVTTPAEATERNEARRLLNALLDQLSDERRQVFILAELEELSAPDISCALGINLNTVYSRLRTARRDFNQALERFHAAQRWRSR